jgi:Family of unknown function (DUF6011)
MNEIKNIKFFEGGKAIFTVSNPKGEYYTFKILHPKKKPFFVSLLNGPDNTSNYVYLGIYNPQNFQIYLTEKSKFNTESTPVKVVRWAIKQISLNKQMPYGYKIQHENKCCRCGRKLTTPESIENGIGPECIKYT